MWTIKKEVVFCLVSTSSEEVRIDAVAEDKKRTGLHSVSTFVEKLFKQLTQCTVD